MINDLRVPNVQTWKYVDDTTVAEIVHRMLLEMPKYLLAWYRTGQTIRICS